eukprot:5877669-Pyramimonas_sp.AAC.1
MASRRQTCVFHSTRGAEIVVADLPLRTELLPVLPLWEIPLRRQIECAFMGYDQAARKVIKAGGLTKLMHLPGAHRIDAAAISERYARGTVDLHYERTQNEAADI